MAGADSTSIAHRAILYILMQNPDHLAKIVAEIGEADTAGKLSTPVKAIESMNLRYTCACVKEAMRIFPPFQFHMPRVAPEHGLEICGYWIPAGHIVGVNPALCQFDLTIFGSNAHEFRPERWLESRERSFAMEKAILHFGAGTRTCLGKNIALMEIHKTIPEVLRNFTFEMSHNRGWKTRNSCFVMQNDFTVYVKRKE
jgi:cytochrome P450